MEEVLEIDSLSAADESSTEEGLDAEFLSSVDELSKELNCFGMNDRILTSSYYIASQSLLSIAWQFVQFIHCNSIAKSDSVLSREYERKLRDEVQSTQTQLQRCKDKLKAKEKEIKSLEINIQNLQEKSLKIQDDKAVLSMRVRKIEAKLEKSLAVHKVEVAAQKADCEKLKDCLRIKLGMASAGKTSALSGSLADDMDLVSISKTPSCTRRGEEAHRQDTILTLTMNNQILVEENFLMRDAFRRLHTLLGAARQEGFILLENIGITNLPGKYDDLKFPESVFKLPVSQAVEKLRNLSEMQVEGILKTFNLIEKSLEKKV